MRLALAAVVMVLIAPNASAAATTAAPIQSVLPSIWLTGAYEGNDCSSDPTFPAGSLCSYTFFSYIQPATGKPGYSSSGFDTASTSVFDPAANSQVPLSTWIPLKHQPKSPWWIELPINLPPNAPQKIAQIYTTAGAKFNATYSPGSPLENSATSTTELEVLYGDEQLLEWAHIPKTTQAAQRCKVFADNTDPKFQWSRYSPRLIAAGFGASTVTTTYGGKLRVIAVGSESVDHFRLYDAAMNPSSFTFPAKNGIGAVEFNVPPGLPNGTYSLGIAAENADSTKSSLPFPCWRMRRPATPNTGSAQAAATQSSASQRQDGFRAVSRLTKHGQLNFTQARRDLAAHSLLTGGHNDNCERCN